MKSMMLTSVYLILICLSSCTNPTVEMPEQAEQRAVHEEVQEPSVIEEVEPEPEYQYTIIGTWERQFDIHKEHYIFTEDKLITDCDGIKNGEYSIEMLEDWTFNLTSYSVVYDYELLHSDDCDILVLNGYQFRRM